NVQGMQSEESGNEGASPERSCRIAKEAEEQQCVGHMKTDVDEMVSPGLQAKELAIQHVGYPRQRVPVAGVVLGERPKESAAAEASFDVVVFGNVVEIVPIHEAVVANGQI